VIVKAGVVIGKAITKSSKNNDPTCHGEIMAIPCRLQKAREFDLSGSIIYTTGYPCPMCLGAILWANIETVYYGCNLEDTETIGFRDSAFYERAQSQGTKRKASSTSFRGRIVSSFMTSIVH
jgi:guanine deaminase